MAIEMCKESVKETSEHSEQRRELINRLVQLRMKLLEIKVTLVSSFVTWCPCYVGRCTIHYPYYECTLLGHSARLGQAL